MGDRSGNLSWVRTSEDKVHRKDLCGSVRAVYVLEKLPDVNRPGLIEAGRYKTEPMGPGVGARCGTGWVGVVDPSLDAAQVAEVGSF